MKNNYVLIGMPGSGKTTIGGMAAEKSGAYFIDTDEEIERKHGDISEIFEEFGEKGFRELETKALKNSCIGGGKVISTGGGIVEIDENRGILKNCVVIFIDRDPEEIQKSLYRESRPLMKDDPEALKRLYKRRYGKYLDTADHVVENNSGPETCVKEILKIIKDSEQA
jgi:shikimate kinase